jgi:hypothetical protein
MSSFIMSQIFPRDQTVLLRIYSSTEENLNQSLILLKDFSPFFHIASERDEDGEDKKIFVTNCYLSK